MPFVVPKGRRRFGWPVKVRVADLEGKEVVQEFTAHFEVAGVDRLAGLLGGDDPLQARGLLQEVWVGWADVVGDDMAPVAFDAQLRDELLQDPAMLRAVATALGDGLAGRREKN